MSAAKEIKLRLQVVEAWRQGSSYQDLSVRYGVSYFTVRKWCLRWQEDNESGLVPRYANCGARFCPQTDKAFRLVRLVAHQHPDWGIPYILCRISRDYPQLPLKGARHYQRHTKRGKNKVARSTLPKAEPVDRARTPHEVWQIDAKERILLKDGSEACYLNITDEKTSAILKTYAFSPWAYLSGTNPSDSGPTP
jgi:hypothetical protein